MPHAQRTKRLETRISPDTLALVKRAAEIQGRSVSDFVVTAVRQAAREAIEDTFVIHLSREDQIAVAEALLDPPPPTPAMLKAAAAYKRIVVRSD